MAATFQNGARTKLGHGGNPSALRYIVSTQVYPIQPPTGLGYAARSKAYQGREQDRATSGFSPDLDQAPGATEDAVHRTSVRAIGRHPRGRHRAADRSTLYWHQARGVRRRGHPRREAGRRRISLYRAAIAARAAPAWRRRG